MSIVLSNDTVQTEAPAGTIVGLLSDTASSQPVFTLLFSGRLFAVKGTWLVTTESPLPIGRHSILVLARGPGIFFINLAIFSIVVAPDTASRVGLGVDKVVFQPQSSPTKPGP